MAQSDNSTAQTLSSRPVAGSRRLPWVLLLLVAAALAFRIVHDRGLHQNDPLHGNLEETPMAVEEALQKAPAADRAPLLLTYAQDPCPALRYAALDELYARQAPQAADLLEQAIFDSDSKVREIGVQQLVDLDPRRGLRLLLCALRDEDTWLREAAILQIKSVVSQKRPGADRRIVPNLVAALDDPDNDVAQTAMNVLRRITGHNWYVLIHAPDAERQETIRHWKQWWGQARMHWPADPKLTDVTPLAPTRTDPCPDFTLYSLDGRLISPKGQHGHLTLLNFWARDCGPCIAESPSLTEMDRRYRSQGVDVIGIHVGSGTASEAQEINAIRDWCRLHDVSYAQAIATAAVRQDFGDIHDVPVTILLDRQSRIRYRWEGGPRDPEVFSAAIERLLKE
jgi:thiol-disulfide isomerase/thioredoxin